jgi:predicted nucleotide-binding protein
MPKSDAGGSPAKKRTKVSQADVPSYDLQKAIRVPKALADSYGSDPTKPLAVAAALEMSPTSGTFRGVCGASVGYGLTDGGPNATIITLTSLGKRIVSPLEEGDDLRALREAAMKPSVAQKFYKKYDGSALPPKAIAQNVLADLGVPGDRTDAVYELLMINARYVGFVKKIKDKEYLDTGAPLPDSAVNQPDQPDEPDDEVDDEDQSEPRDTLSSAVEAAKAIDAASPAEPRPDGRKNAIFVGHGSNRAPMDQLLKILNEYSIPHKQAVDEANRARPIPQKVAEVMRECGAAVLVFTADKEYFDKQGDPIWRPSENVSHELGAASVLYGDRIIIFKEKGIELPSNFSSVGYIEFEKDKLGEKGIELFRELVSMKIVSISVG